MELLVLTFEDFRDNFADRFLSGLAFMLVIMPISVMAVLMIYVFPIIGAIPGMVFDSEELMLVGIVLGFIVGIVATIVALNALIMPMYASLMRATVISIREETDLGFGASFNTVTQDLVNVLLLALLLVPLGPLSFLFVFALPGVVVHKLSPIEAIKRAGAHFAEDPGWHMGFVALKFAITIVLSYVPFVGAAILYPFVLRFEMLAYLDAFGDGSEHGSERESADLSV